MVRPCQRNSSVSKVAGFGYDGRGSFPTGAQICLLLTTCKQALQNFNPVWVLGYLSLETKRPDRKANQSRGSILFLVLLFARIKAEMSTRIMLHVHLVILYTIHGSLRVYPSML
jgi:hypothetical protein